MFYGPASGVLLGKVVAPEYLHQSIELVVKVTKAVDVMYVMIPLEVLVRVQPHDWQAVEDCVVAHVKYQIGHADRTGHFNTFVDFVAISKHSAAPDSASRVHVRASLQVCQ